MKNFCYLFLLIFFATSNVSAQSNKNTAPVNWEKFKITNEKITVTFPKLPVKLEFSDICNQIEGNNYYAYAEGVVYELKIFQKSEFAVPDYCPEKKEFSETSFTNYVTEILTNQNFTAKQNLKIGKSTFLNVERKGNLTKISRWLLNDYENFRWFEFNISSYEDLEVDEKKFISSLKLKANKKAIEINEGSEMILGDEVEKRKNTKGEKKSKTEENEDGHSNPLTIITKPKPKYTDAARENNTTGSVRVRVTFLDSGAIGSVTPVNTLENGLTEQAIKAARKMAFLPQRQKNKKVSVTKVVVYTFTIY